MYENFYHASSKALFKSLADSRINAKSKEFSESKSKIKSKIVTENDKLGCSCCLNVMMGKAYDRCCE